MSLHLFNNVKEPTKTPAQLPYPFFSGRSARQVCCDCLGDRVGHRCGDTHLGGPPTTVNTKLHFYDIFLKKFPSGRPAPFWAGPAPLPQVTRQNGRHALGGPYVFQSL